MNDWIDWEKITKAVLDKSGAQSRLHGPQHWRRVALYGQWLANQCGGDMDVIRLFALLHDSCRLNDLCDPRHGERAGEFAKSCQGKLFKLSPQRLDTLITACHHHAHGQTHNDPTIGACWDADRFDLRRVGCELDEDYMSCQIAKSICRSRDFETLRSVSEGHEVDSCLVPIW